MKTKHTPGPWAWFANSISKQVYLATEGRGRVFVMDFVRFGTQQAAPRFQIRGEAGNGVMFRADELSDPDHNGDFKVDHPDANLIAAAPEMYEALEKAQEFFYKPNPTNESAAVARQAIDEALRKANGEK